MKILILGSNGQLGKELNKTLTVQGFNVVSYSKNDLDICDSEKLAQIFHLESPKIVINAAAYTNVGQAEKERELAYKINADSLEQIGLSSLKLNAKVIHFSTDYVFNGLKHSAYKEGDEPSPVNNYGSSKLMGERVLLEANPSSLIFRISWVQSKYGRNFISKIIDLAKVNSEVKVVSNQFGSPITCSLIASLLSQIILKHCVETNYLNQFKGIYHLSTVGEISWFDLVSFIKELSDENDYFSPLKDVKIIPVLSSEFKSDVLRPDYSVLDNSRFINDFQIILPHWKEAIKDEYCRRL